MDAPVHCAAMQHFQRCMHEIKARNTEPLRNYVRRASESHSQMLLERQATTGSPAPDAPATD